LHEKDQKYFELLKQKIIAVMQQSYPGINTSIEDWKGQEITDFQEDLRIKANANISEKWFYTHLKSTHTTLPRIDMLNFLSKYAGYANWDDFMFRNRPEAHAKTSSLDSNRYFILVPVLTIVILCILYGLFRIFNTREYRFTFIDADTREPITNVLTEVILLPEGESPVHNVVGSDGVFHFRTDKSKIKMIVSSPYYRTDTILRFVKKLNRDETVMLKPDDYAMMIHYFSMTKVADWEKRRNRLNAMIDDGAMIYQVINSKEATGMALYNKQEFIDKLTMPSGSLKSIEILSSQSRDEKIMVLRFRINEKRK
jgi:hypothetical protein